MRLAELHPGDVFATDYTVVGPLGEGGMSALYVVEQRSTSKRRALKLMRPELVDQPAFRRRFELEARVGASIPSDHVVEVIASGVEDGAPWLVMELLEGEDLATFIARLGGAPVDEARAILAQLCHALGAAHARAIVHRDVKPANVFLAKARRTDVPFTVKVLDFGIARMKAEVRGTQVPSTRGALGTPLYMAPEQADVGAAITPATDVWALGLVAFELLTGHNFWRSAGDNSILAVARETLLDALPRASARAADLGARVPEGFDAWFARCVDRAPGERFQDATAAFAALAPLLGGEPLPPAAAPVRPRGVPRALLVGVAVLVVVGAVVVGTQIGRRRPAAAGRGEAPIAARSMPTGRPITAATAGPDVRLPTTGVAACDDLIRVAVCESRFWAHDARVQYLKEFRQQLMDALALGGAAAMSENCRTMMVNDRPNAAKLGCAR